MSCRGRCQNKKFVENQQKIHVFFYHSSHYSLVLQFYVLQKIIFVNKLKAKTKLIY